MIFSIILSKSILQIIKIMLFYLIIFFLIPLNQGQYMVKVNSTCVRPFSYKEPISCADEYASWPLAFEFCPCSQQTFTPKTTTSTTTSPAAPTFTPKKIPKLIPAEPDFDTNNEFLTNHKPTQNNIQSSTKIPPKSPNNNLACGKNHWPNWHPYLFFAAGFISASILALMILGIYIIIMFCVAKSRTRHIARRTARPVISHPTEMVEMSTLGGSGHFFEVEL